ncbi:MAG: hypothetical protein H6506_04820 [Calditrichaeota bacterium]|nr:hypothetical protein [Calditrichota bacterium]MCB9391958.1 hypothetical protein [Calditrichota bacterium]
MRIVLLLALLWTAAWAEAAEVKPQPLVKTAGELAWEAIPDTIPDDQQVQIAREYLDKYPNEIPLLRSVQNILNRKSDLDLDFWKNRMETSPTAANHYLYARKSSDPAVMKEQSEWIMRNDPNNFWGYYLAAVAEWSKDSPDMNVVAGFFEQAIPKDPSRPEGWGYAAQAYEELKNWDKALEMYGAELVTVPAKKSTLLSMLGIYAQKRDADKYFAMLPELMAKEPPLNVDLAMYNTDHRVTSAELSGRYTVLDLFTYW